VYVQDHKNGLYSFGIPFVPLHSGWVLAGQGFLAVTASEAFDFDGLDAVEVSVSALVGATAFSGAEFLAATMPVRCILWARSVGMVCVCWVGGWFGSS
jgi:hypothetical protein